ncbi:MAG TPA: GNAT family N-acetyltransferase [Hymenobacter sp.]|jgi:GNAT superfamily N-acetyltransferase
MLLRAATLDDVIPLNQLVELSVRQLSKGHYAPAQIDSAIRYVFGVDTQLIADETYFVAEQGGQVVGCGGWSKRNTLYGGDQSKKSSDPLLAPQQDAARIRAFFVHPAWARQGIGTRIMHQCEEAAWQAGFRRLELASTLPGEPLYAALGYVSREHFVLPFPDGEQLALIRMDKLLPA